MKEKEELQALIALYPSLMRARDRSSPRMSNQSVKSQKTIRFAHLMPLVPMSLPITCQERMPQALASEIGGGPTLINGQTWHGTPYQVLKSGEREHRRQMRGKEFKREPNSPLLSQDNFSMLVLQEKM